LSLAATRVAACGLNPWSFSRGAVWIYYSAQLIVVATKGAIAAPETPLARLAAEKELKNEHEATSVT